MSLLLHLIQLFEFVHIIVEGMVLLQLFLDQKICLVLILLMGSSHQFHQVILNPNTTP